MRKKIIISIPLILFGICLILYFCFPGVLLQIFVNIERGNANLTQKEVQVREHRIVYLTNDPEGALQNRPVIVFFHGFAADKDNWTRMAQFFKDDYRLFALDQPGFGESSRIQSHTYTLPGQNEYIHEALVKLGVAGPGKVYHIVGNSMGGNLVGLYGVAYPEEVASIAFFNPGGIISAKPSIFQRTRKETGRNLLLVDSAEDFDRVVKLTMTEVPFIPGPIKTYFAERALKYRAFNDKIYKEAFIDHTNTLEAILPDIKAPSLILWGDDDRVLDVSGAKIMEEKMTGSKTKTVIMKRCGHAPMIERPEETARHYREFLVGLTGN